MKLSPFYTAIAHLARELDRAGADGLVLFNRFYQPDIDAEELTATRTLHLSDSTELRLRLHWLAILSGRVRASLAVTGGVHTAIDVIKATMAGAHVAQMVSALLMTRAWPSAPRARRPDSMAAGTRVVLPRRDARQHEPPQGAGSRRLRTGQLHADVAGMARLMDRGPCQIQPWVKCLAIQQVIEPEIRELLLHGVLPQPRREIDEVHAIHLLILVEAREDDRLAAR